MPKAIEIVIGPSILETGGISRAVTMEDGSGQVQTYSSVTKAWFNGGGTFQSLLTSEDVTRERLERLGFDEEDMENIFSRPEDEQEAK